MSLVDELPSHWKEIPLPSAMNLANVRSESESADVVQGPHFQTSFPVTFLNLYNALPSLSLSLEVLIAISNGGVQSLPERRRIPFLAFCESPNALPGVYLGSSTHWAKLSGLCCGTSLWRSSVLCDRSVLLGACGAFPMFACAIASLALSAACIASSSASVLDCSASRAAESASVAYVAVFLALSWTLSETDSGLALLTSSVAACAAFEAFSAFNLASLAASAAASASVFAFCGSGVSVHCSTFAANLAALPAALLAAV